MKILKVEFENINSLRKRHLIDFSEPPFVGNSLFAITGPTGSGKSSILDVISLALFNKVPRLGKITKKEILEKGAILSKNQQDAFAKVTYECMSGKFSSTWSISTNRNGNLREHEMEIVDLSTGKILDLKKSEVPSRNEELIGLNYDQFNKSVVLAQGEFAQFLKAKKHERGELLEKITGTGIYRQLGRMAFEKFREVNSVIQEQQQKIALIRPKILEKARQQEVTATLQQKEKACISLGQEIDSLKNDVQVKENISKRLREITSVETEKARSEKALATFEQQHGQSLKQHEKVREFSEEVRLWSRIIEEAAVLQKELFYKKNEEEVNFSELEECLKATGSFTRMEVTAENLSEKLETFSKRVTELQEARQEKRISFKHLEAQIQSVLNDLDHDLSGEPQEKLTILEELKFSSAKRLAEFQEDLQLDLNNPERKKNRLRETLKKLRKAQQDWGQLEQLKKELNRAESELEKIELLKKELPTEIAELKQQVETLNLQLENLELKKQNQLLLASMEEHRTQLIEGQPCHLCGSLEHPYAVHLPEQEDSFDKEIERLKGNLKELNHKYSSHSSNLQNLERQLKELKSYQRSLSDNYILNNSNFANLYGELQSVSEIKDWEQECLLVEEQLLKLEKYEEEQRVYKAVSAGIPLHLKLNEVLKEGKVLKNQLDEIYTGTDIHRDCQKLQGDWIRFSQEQANLRKQQQELTKKLEEKESHKQLLEQQLHPPLLEKGFENIAAACTALLPDRQYLELYEQKDKTLENLNAELTSLKLLNSQLQKFRENERTETRESLLEILDAKVKTLETERNECEEYRRVLKNDSEFLKELETLKMDIAAQEKSTAKWRMLNELIGDATGKKFNDYAQDLTLAQLLQMANVRLRNLSDRYRIDKPFAEEDDSLVIIDEHMGGQRRSIKTLSGGETFILSLSMALGLSDLASRNVEIDSLFIDEGFGSLDPETLDQTLDTLERLQAESSKTIGIISHVESLKERIATQIQLKRNGQGYSQLKVVG